MTVSSDTPDVDRLRFEAERCRVFASQEITQETRTMMLSMAEQFEAEADRLEAEVRRGPTMMLPRQGQ